MRAHAYMHRFKSGTVARVGVRLPRPGQRVSIPYLIRWNRTPLPSDAPEYRAWQERIAGDLEELTGWPHRMTDAMPMFAEEVARKKTDTMKGELNEHHKWAAQQRACHKGRHRP